MDITQKFLAFTLLGATWVLWLLICLSVISVAVMIERGLFLARRRTRLDLLSKDVRTALHGGDVDKVASRWEKVEGMEPAVAAAGLRHASRGAAAAAEAMLSVRAEQRHQMERGLAILGTLGNNAPFIGLFGTVLGIIKAFHDLAENEAGAKAVMSGVSEALVATAIGLLVAIPAVLMYNFFQRRVRAAVSNADSLAHQILTELRAEKPDRADEAGKTEVA